MANTITLYYEAVTGPPTQVAQLTDTSVSLDNSGTNVIYSGDSVNLIEAALDTDAMIATITPLSGSTAFEVRTMTPSFSHSPMTRGGASWRPSGSGTELTFISPLTSGHEITWLLNPASPPVRLTVKIKRN